MSRRGPISIIASRCRFINFDFKLNLFMESLNYIFIGLFFYGILVVYLLVCNFDYKHNFVSNL